MASGLITPGLVLEVVEAGEDLVITQEEFSGIMGSITSIAIGIMMVGFVSMLMGVITKGFTKETGIKTKKVAGVTIPIYSH